MPRGARCILTAPAQPVCLYHYQFRSVRLATHVIFHPVRLLHTTLHILAKSAEPLLTADPHVGDLSAPPHGLFTSDGQDGCERHAI